MPPAPLAGNVVTGTRDQPGAPGTRAPAPVTRGRRLWKARALLPRRAARRAQAALPRPGPKAGASYHDPLFGRPDLVEDDYYRFRHQPRGG